MNRIRVCQCVDDLLACGAQQVVRHLIERLDRSRYDPIVYTFRNGPLTSPITESGVPIRVIPRRVPKLDPTLIHRIRRQLMADRIEILHMHLFGSSLHGTLATLALPDLTRVISLHTNREDNRMQYTAYPLLFGMAHSVVAVSRDASQQMTRRFRGLSGKLVTIPNGIDTDAYEIDPSRGRILTSLGLPADARIVGAVGRLSPEKGHTVLLEAFQRVKANYPDAYLLIVGGGDLHDSLVQRTRELGIDTSVRYLGVRRDVPQLMKIIDVFTLSSLYEGLPLVILEAMASGATVVASNVGGVPEIIEDEREGLLVPPSDPPALAAAIMRILSDPNLAARLRLAAMTTVRARYSAKHMASRHEALYATLHGGRRAPSARRAGDPPVVLNVPDRKREGIRS